MFQQQQKKKKKYHLQKEHSVDLKRVFLIVISLTIVIALTVIFSSLDLIPGGITFKFIVQKTPNSMIFMLLFSLTINVCTTMLAKALIDTNELQRKMKLIKEHNKDKKEIEKLKTENPKMYQKKQIQVKRKEASIKKMTQNVSMQRMKPSCVTMLPMLLLFFFIRSVFDIPTTLAVGVAGFWIDVIPGGSVGVARTIMNPYPELQFLASYLFPTPDVVYWGMQGYIGFTAFYFLCSFSVSVIVQRLSGMATSGMGGMGGIPGFGDQSLK
nr:EMC3/TMCO1 family protein [Candidatus Sigynarchaeota archaeon]